jgi:hypothetical protein
VADDDRFCTNCRAVIPPGEDVCPTCGVYAGDVFDGRLPRAGRRRMWPLVLVMLLVLGAGAVWLFWPQRQPVRFDTGPARVVRGVPGASQRPPGAKLNQAEATRTLRRFLASPERGSAAVSSECLAVISRGYGHGVYAFSAVNRCDGASLGGWDVDAKTERVSRAR